MPFTDFTFVVTKRQVLIKGVLQAAYVNKQTLLPTLYAESNTI